ncbi:hypothetical protein GJU40_19945 [Bacillus lacus]|uniref:Uncharacterized protein n=1 Tax=Metabacillus lacus TaxID=1983721 RepID=A0A7X2J2Y0_9BACI|nr:hypothetical protein [Metabacillus lacus]MRX74396.1 hypothetical protein [Metabacillus lacus]
MAGSSIKGELENIDSERLLKREQLKLQPGQPFSFKVSADYFPMVYVDKKGDQANRIEVSIYSTAFILEGFDMSQEMTPLQILFQKNTLSVAPVPMNYNLSIYRPSYLVKQAEGPSMPRDSVIMPRQLIYLKVPPNLDIEYDEEVYINFVN